MYRQYEDARALEKELESLKTKLSMLRKRIIYHNIDDYSIEELTEQSCDLQMQISELEERVNFAWQDEEYEEDMRIAEKHQYGYEPLEEKMRENGVSWKDFF